MQNILLFIMCEANLIQKDHLAKYTEKIPDDAMSYLINNCKLSEDDIAQTIANYYSHYYQALNYQQFGTSDWQKLSQLPLNQWQCLPLVTDHTVTVYLSDPNHIAHIDQIKYHYTEKIKIVFCTHSQFQQTLTHVMAQICYYQTHHKCAEDYAAVLTKHLFNDAISKNASDIHIEAKHNHSLIRFRLDGLLYTIAKLHKNFHQPLISRLKVLCQLDISEQRKPQDGRFNFISTASEKFDCRFSTCASLHGEKSVIRLNNARQHALQLNQLGLTPQQLIQIKKTKQCNQGLILVTGPTGSGKTNTLYALLNYLNDAQKNICTIENPIEIELPYLNQMSTQTNIGLDFHILLRTLLRQDPDIIMIGEIRDQETANTAIKAAQTGHLVLSTLHTNSCVETIIRLQHMKIPLHHIINTTKLIIAQRLVRKLCPICKNNQPHCNHCYKGYHGRQGLFEVLPLNESFCDFAMKNILDRHNLQHQAEKIGMLSLQKNAAQFIENQITDQAEISRVISHEI
ncbi:MAG: type II/IV secretion system protein [Coxiellaceae bacterium]|nr:type II/IV secretion system protein [Coxiellaceae bacterium]